MSIRRNDVFPRLGYLGQHFSSSVPINYKIIAIPTLLFRAYHLSSDFINFSNGIDFMKQKIVNNGCSLNLIEHCINRFINKTMYPP